MGDDDRVVYLEDLEQPVVAATKENVSLSVTEKTDTTATTVIADTKLKKTSSLEKKTATGATKRQRSLMDMFPSGSSTVSSSSSSRDSKVAKTGTPSLNSIPFSMSDFQSELSDEEKMLLQLECETMGKSW